MAILGAWYHSVMAVLLILSCILLVLVVLVQRGRGGGLAGAFGGVGGHSVLGSRTGDFLTWVTISFAALFILLSIVLDRLTPPTPEPQDISEIAAPGEPTKAALEAKPETLAQGQDLKLTYTPSNEQEGQIEKVEFYLGAKPEGAGDRFIDKDNYAEDGWAWSVVTRGWPVGAHALVARAVKPDGTAFPWVQAEVTITEAPPASASAPAGGEGEGPQTQPAPETPQTQPAAPGTPEAPEAPSSPPATTEPAAAPVG